MSDPVISSDALGQVAPEQAPMVNETLFSNALEPAKEMDFGDVDDAPKWMIDKTTPGIGERPEWWNDKYNSVEDLNQGYNELSKKLGEPTKPVEYDLGFLGDHSLNVEDPALQGFIAKAKESNIKQEFLEDAINMYVQNEASKHQTAEQVIAQLGEGGQEKVNNITNWIANNFEPEQQEKLASLTTSAENIEILEICRSQGAPLAIPTTIGFVAPQETTAQLQSELNGNYAKYGEDRSYAKSWQDRWEKASMREGA